MTETKFRVWWIPQVPMAAFEVDVSSPEEGRKLCDILARYDAFQFEHKVKPDYSNVGGVKFKHDLLTDGEWHDWPDDEFEAICLKAEIAIAAPFEREAS